MDQFNMGLKRSYFQIDDLEELQEVFIKHSESSRVCSCGCGWNGRQETR